MGVRDHVAADAGGDSHTLFGKEDEKAAGCSGGGGSFGRGTAEVMGIVGILFASAEFAEGGGADCGKARGEISEGL